MKVIYNNCYGGFSLSERAVELYNQTQKVINSQLKPIDIYTLSGKKHRTDPILIEVIEKLGKSANGRYANLKVVEIPDEYSECFYISKYDGLEHVICDPRRLIMHRLKSELKGRPVSDLTDSGCRTLLQELVAISNTEEQHY